MPKNPNLITAFHLKSGETIGLADLEKHGLSYVPCDQKSPAVERFAHLWNKREQITLASYGESDKNWSVVRKMTGVQIMTGQPTFLPSDTSPSGYLYLMDFDIENRIKTHYPQHHKRLIDTIYRLHGDRTPCHVETKSGGDRFSLYVPGFSNKIMYYDTAVFDRTEEQVMLFEFFSKNGLSRLDERYALLKGSIFEIPQFHLAEEVNDLTDAVVAILELIGFRKQTRTASDAKVVERSQIGDLDIAWRETTIAPEQGEPYKALVSQLFPTEVCRVTNHKSNRKEVSFTKFSNGGVLGHCFNCEENWWEEPPKTQYRKLVKLQKDASAEKVEKLTPFWQFGITPIELLHIFLKSVGNDENAPVGVIKDILTFSIPPQAPVGILPQIALLSATSDTADTKKAFDGQPVSFSCHEGNAVEWAKGVRVYQYQEARLTAASIFEYPVDAKGNRLLQKDPIALSSTAADRIAKLNDWAEMAEGKSAFVSYKEIVELFSASVNMFDVVTHFDKVSGLNFDGLKFLVVFGYPKVKHEVVMEHARRQNASDPEPLPPTGSYHELTEEVISTENGITSQERRYIDPRLEKVRHQLATEKLHQAFGRGRHVVWEGTETILYTSAPLANTTQQATLFSSAAFKLAKRPNELGSAMQQIEESARSGDRHAIMQNEGIAERTAYRRTEKQRSLNKSERDSEIMRLHSEGVKQADIVRRIFAQFGKINQGTVSRVIRKNMQN